jgi:hypothetical protein
LHTFLIILTPYVLCAVDQNGKGGSKIEHIQKNSIAAASSIGCLSRRLGDGRPPSDAFIGDYSIGTMMSTMGCTATPSADKPLPSKALRPLPGTDYDYHPGTYTIATHGSSEFSGRCDCVNMVLPASIWEKSADPEEVERELRDAFNMVDVDGSGEIDASELRGLAKMLGMRMSNKDIEQAMSEMDGDGSGEVSHTLRLQRCRYTLSRNLFHVLTHDGLADTG